LARSSAGNKSLTINIEEFEDWLELKFSFVENRFIFVGFENKDCRGLFDFVLLHQCFILTSDYSEQQFLLEGYGQTLENRRGSCFVSEKKDFRYR